MGTAGRYDGGGGATPDWSIRLAGLGASRIEAFLDAEGCWWAMPYKFADGATAEGFLSRLRVENPGREFRVAA